MDGLLELICLSLVSHHGPAIGQIQMVLCRQVGPSTSGKDTNTTGGFIDPSTNRTRLIILAIAGIVDAEWDHTHTPEAAIGRLILEGLNTAALFGEGEAGRGVAEDVHVLILHVLDVLDGGEIKIHDHCC